MMQTTARKNCSEEFRRQAVDVCESIPGATVRGACRGVASRLSPTTSPPSRWSEGARSLRIERSSCYAWKAGGSSRAERALPTQDETCGASPITAELNDSAPAGERADHKRAARVQPTIPGHSGREHPDLLGRELTADLPNRRDVADVTSLSLTDGTNLYLATVIDGHSRRLEGRAVADRTRTEVVADALNAAAATRSMGAAGFSADSASAESFDASPEREVLHDIACWADERTCRRQVVR